MISTWNLAPPPGFHGLDPHKPLKVYVRHLPHWRQDGATYFVTFRLHDSLPQHKLRELEGVHAEWERKHPPPHSDKDWADLTREVMARIECWLDQGMGSCRLKQPGAAQEVVNALHHFDGKRYELGCYVIMPNHVHGVVRPLSPQSEPLEKILQSWKRFTSRQINLCLGLKGSLWQEESFDRIIRNPEHLYRVIQYIGQNPSKAALDVGQYCLWVRPEWERGGWGFARRL